MKNRPIRISGVEAADRSLSGGKAAGKYWSKLKRVCEERGVQFTLISGASKLRMHNWYRPSDLYILAFNESRVVQNQEDLAKIKKLEQILSGKRYINCTQTAELIGHKGRLNEYLDSCGISVPRIMTPSSDQITYPVFCIPQSGSGETVQTIQSGPLPSDHHCSELIDTTVSIDGKDYFAYIRAMVTGNKILALTPRVRPTTDKDRSVHGRDMQLDANLLNKAYQQIIVPRKKSSEIFAIT